MKALPSKSELDEIFAYDEESGRLFNKIHLSPRARAGQESGSLDSRGYRRVGILGINYATHRIIWKLMTGADPVDHIDHIDHDRTNNRFSNLREVSPRENQRNQSMRNDNTSGVCGVHWDKASGKWTAQIMVEGRHVNLGRFIHRFHAIRARKLAEVGHGYHVNHGCAASA